MAKAKGSAGRMSEPTARYGKRAYEMTQYEFMHYRPLPPTTMFPLRGQINTAVEADDGTIYWSNSAGIVHVMLIRLMAIPPERIRSGGFIQDGVYEPTRGTDTMNYAEIENAKRRIEWRNAVFQAMRAGNRVPARVQKDWESKYG